MKHDFGKGMRILKQVTTALFRVPLLHFCRSLTTHEFQKETAEQKPRIVSFLRVKTFRLVLCR
jgi:hypothetical protein